MKRTANDIIKAGQKWQAKKEETTQENGEENE